MAKLGRKTYPTGHGPDDFECFGPAATVDGEFENCMIADLGCFNQEMIDSNKFYHGAVVKSKKNGQWYAYFEWGRTGQTADFLFEEAYSKEAAQEIFAKQLHSKNDKRGEWSQIAGRKTLRAKEGKDCYLVRPAARRTTGLPDAQKIINADGVKTPAKPTPTKQTTKTSSSRWDSKTLELGRALTGATIAYTKRSFAGDYLPTQSAIDLGRDILTEALKRVQKVGDNTTAQAKDKELRQLTTELYSRIPKVKPVGADESVWILGGNNITDWQNDLDAFEAGLLSLDAGATDEQAMDDPFVGFDDLEMKWMDPATAEGKFISKWMPDASANRHHHVGRMKIMNMWAIRQPKLVSRFNKTIENIGEESKTSGRERPKFQPDARPDLSDAQAKLFKKANVCPLFHGTRSVNCAGILRTGLKLPNQLVGVAITGAMFGPGLYWADDWRKSDGYTSRSGGYWSGGSGGVKGRGAFMFVGNVALGTPHVASGYGGYTHPPKGCHSIAGLAGKSGVQNNEWIVFNTAQQYLAYLVEYGA